MSFEFPYNSITLLIFVYSHLSHFASQLKWTPPFHLSLSVTWSPLPLVICPLSFSRWCCVSPSLVHGQGAYFSLRPLSIPIQGPLLTLHLCIFPVPPSIWEISVSFPPSDLSPLKNFIFCSASFKFINVELRPILCEIHVYVYSAQEVYKSVCNLEWARDFSSSLDTHMKISPKL